MNESIDNKLPDFRRKIEEKLKRELENIQTLSAEELFNFYPEYYLSVYNEQVSEIRNKLKDLQVIFDASPTSIWFKDTRNSFILVNEAAAKIAGRPIAEVEGKSTDEIFPKESAKFYRDDMEVIQSGEPKYGIIEEVTAQEKSRWVRTDKIPWHGPKGEIEGIIAFATDITEEKNAQDQLKEKVFLLRTVISNAPISIFATDKKGVFTLHEGKAVERVGMKPGDNVGLSAYDLFSELKIVEHNGKVTSGRSVLDRVLKGNTLSGLTELNGVFFNNHFGPILSDENKVLGLIGVATDITDYQLAFEALKESEKQLREAQRIAKMGHWEWDIETGKVTWSKELFTLFGVKDKQPNYEFVKSITHPEDREFWEKSVNDAIVGARKFNIDYRAIRSDNSVMWIHNEAEIIKNKHGKPIIMWGSAQDITERKNLEQEINQYKNILRSILDTDPNIIFTIDKNQKILFANKALADFYSTTVDKIEGKNQANIHSELNMPINELNRWHNDNLKVIEKNESLNFIEYGHNRKGVPGWYRTRKIPLKNPGEETVVLVISENITGLKKAEEKIKRYAKNTVDLQEMEKRKLSQELHDEIGQSLTAIRINLSSLTKSLIDTIDKKTLARLQETDEIVESVLTQIHSISISLRPPMLDIFGLATSINSYCRQFSERSGLLIHHNIQLNVKLIPDEEIALFRIVQESFTNIAKHAKRKNCSSVFNREW